MIAARPSQRATITDVAATGIATPLGVHTAAANPAGFQHATTMLLKKQTLPAQLPGYINCKLEAAALLQPADELARQLLWQCSWAAPVITCLLLQ
jgi:hypothetical protein